MAEEKVIDVLASYDRIAEEYARRIYGELENKPFDRKLLDRFADSVDGEGVTCDLGCGPGHIARYLHQRGIAVCGMDLSSEMIGRARKLNPGIEFHQGDMRALQVPGGAWAGIAAFYAIVNLPPEDIVKALHEMTRVLQPGGRLLLSFHLGQDDLRREEDLWGSGVALEITFFRASTIAGYMRSAGLEIDEIVEREPYSPEVEYQSRRAYIFSHKPS